METIAEREKRFASSSRADAGGAPCEQCGRYGFRQDLGAVDAANVRTLFTALCCAAGDASTFAAGNGPGDLSRTQLTQRRGCALPAQPPGDRLDDPAKKRRVSATQANRVELHIHAAIAFEILRQCIGAVVLRKNSCRDGFEQVVMPPRRALATTR